MQKRTFAVFVLFLLSSFIFISTGYTDSRMLDVKYSQLTKDAKLQVDCLADNIYYEAGYEPEQGKVAVAFVTMNRLQDPRFPKDICSVVKQRVKSTCQFSWFCENKRPAHAGVYHEARAVALKIYANYEQMRDVTEGALYYHADYVNPRWKLEKTAVIGRHIFYKEKDGI